MNASILVVDDDPAIRGLLTRALREEHYIVLEAKNGAQALGMIDGAGGPIDLVLTDICMPVLDGIELGRRLAVRQPSLPVAYMSGDSAATIAERAGHTRVAPLLVKPFSMRALLGMLTPLLMLGHERRPIPAD